MTDDLRDALFGARAILRAQGMDTSKNAVLRYARELGLTFRDAEAKRVLGTACSQTSPAGTALSCLSEAAKGGSTNLTGTARAPQSAETEHEIGKAGTGAALSLISAPVLYARATRLSLRRRLNPRLAIARLGGSRRSRDADASLPLLPGVVVGKDRAPEKRRSRKHATGAMPLPLRDETQIRSSEILALIWQRVQPVVGRTWTRKRWFGANREAAKGLVGRTDAEILAAHTAISARIGAPAYMLSRVADELLRADIAPLPMPGRADGRAPRVEIPQTAIAAVFHELAAPGEDFAALDRRLRAEDNDAWRRLWGLHAREAVAR